MASQAPPSQADSKAPRTANSAQPTSLTHMGPKKPSGPTPNPILNMASQNAQQKKVPRRSSKPIINWFQRKLAGSGKNKRAENVPLRISELGVGRNSSNSGRTMNRITSSPLPVQSTHFLKQQRPDAASLARRKTRSISLYGDEELHDLNNQYPEEEFSMDQSSLNRDSIWSPTSALEADDDASVRPLPPSSPPSPSPSRSSSSYLSDPRTFRSMAASTKPTTLLSIDLNGNGMAHIAQAPTPPPTQINRLAPHVRQSSSLSSAGLLSSGASITFSSIPNAQPSSRPTSLRNPGSLGSISLNTQQTTTYHHVQVSSVQAPLHSYHHPRNNPRPSSPPLDNASVLTLASSAFGIPNRLGNPNYNPSALGDSVSQYGGSVTFPDAESAYVPGDDERLEERDFDASVRALRPRSSRRGSWESEASRWSARVQGGTPSLLMDRSLWTSNSVRTGHFSTENGDQYETADETIDDTTGEGLRDDKEESPLDLPPGGVHITVDKPASPVIETDCGLTDPNSHVLTSPLDSRDDSIAIHSNPRTSTDTIALPLASAETDVVSTFKEDSTSEKEVILVPDPATKETVDHASPS